jgi:flagellar biosynthesis anti-sigma factor FlgM
MRIDLNHGPQATSESGASSAQSAAAARSAVASVGEDQAQLSGTQVQVQALAAQALQLPEVRQDRVSALRQAFLNGQYHATSETVAGAVFGHMLAATAA